jgi:hypothetical protein
LQQFMQEEATERRESECIEVFGHTDSRSRRSGIDR